MSHKKSCDLVQLELSTKENGTLHMTALVITTQPIRLSGERYEHLEGLDLADSADISDALEIDVLIGSDFVLESRDGKYHSW